MKRYETSPSSRQQGFTLIELSIVLVIIGLRACKTIIVTHNAGCAILLA